MSEGRLRDYHEYTRRHGVNRAVYVIFRLVLQPACLLWFRLERSGRAHAKVGGGLIVASNHCSFLDPFVIGMTLPWSRPGHFLAKAEMFESRWQGWVLNRLGAFPVKRGQSDETAIETAQLIVERGGVVIMFPEGTRVRTGSLGRPRRGVGRLALETGAQVLPVSVGGSGSVRRGWRIRPRKVRVRAGEPLVFPISDPASPELAGKVTERIWASVEFQGTLTRRLR